jgi:hypothetical protein
MTVYIKIKILNMGLIRFHNDFFGKTENEWTKPITSLLLGQTGNREIHAMRIYDTVDPNITGFL